ncbi:triose-phosphate isomerase [Cetobacterium sp. SF1]|uniref:triose-phosphate isomerase n=1 Tax=unclassified Cetobacterium TaxID=2630983 RepID=UPI003CEB7268
MRKTIIAGNWKMNKTSKETREMLAKLKELTMDVQGVEMVIGAPFTALEAAVETVKGSRIEIAAQNMYPKDNGAYTGEVSPVMLKELGVKYVILGHSERREYFHESNEFINSKVKAALAHDLIPILCIGEKLEDREAGRTAEVNEKQLREGLAGLTAEEAKKTVVAYEPVWAIGTGKTATPEMAEATHEEIRQVLADMFGSVVAEEMTIQYGGSMNAKNAKELLAQRNIDGGLVGGASLDAETFAQVIKAGL